MKLIFALLLSLTCLPAMGHSGRTNAQGCHNDNRNGGYHCHNGSRSSSAGEPAGVPTRPTPMPPKKTDTTPRVIPVSPSPTNFSSPRSRKISVSTPMDFDLCVAHIEYLDEKGLVRGLTKNTLREYEAQLVDGKLIGCQISHIQVITP